MHIPALYARLAAMFLISFAQTKCFPIPKLKVFALGLNYWKLCQFSVLYEQIYTLIAPPWCPE